MAKGFPVLPEQLGGGSYFTEPRFPGLTMAAERGRRNQTTGKCDPVWGEWEVGLWRKIHTGV